MPYHPDPQVVLRDRRSITTDTLDRLAAELGLHLATAPGRRSGR